MAEQKPRILAIDDTPANLFTLGSVLADEYDLQIAGSGRDGLAMAARKAPDLILLDVMMPEIDGFETCRRFKADPALADVPVIFLTALTEYDSELTGLSLGAVEYIAKPFRVDLVKQRISNILKVSRLSRELRASEERLRFVMAATGDGIWDWDMTTDEVRHNPAWWRMLGLDPRLSQHSMTEVRARVHPDDAALLDQAMTQCLAGETSFACEYRLRHAHGHDVWVSDRGDVVQRSVEGKPLRMVGSISDISLRKDQEDEIRQLAFYDTLTELPNRRLFMDRLQQSIVSKKRSHTWGALLFLDMDRFKELNDTHGHAMGDLLLIKVARRLQKCVRQTDTAARFGGDEFVVLLEGFEGDAEQVLNDACAVGEKVLHALNQPYCLGVLDYPSTPSIGLTVFNGEESDLDAVLKRADTAMYDATMAGRNTLRVFAPKVLSQ